MPLVIIQSVRWQKCHTQISFPKKCSNIMPTLGKVMFPNYHSAKQNMLKSFSSPIMPQFKGGANQLWSKVMENRVLERKKTPTKCWSCQKKKMGRDKGDQTPHDHDEIVSFVAPILCIWQIWVTPLGPSLNFCFRAQSCGLSRLQRKINLKELDF